MPAMYKLTEDLLTVLGEALRKEKRTDIRLVFGEAGDDFDDDVDDSIQLVGEDGKPLFFADEREAGGKFSVDIQVGSGYASVNRHHYDAKGDFKAMSSPGGYREVGLRNPGNFTANLLKDLKAVISAPYWSGPAAPEPKP